MNAWIGVRSIITVSAPQKRRRRCSRPSPFHRDVGGFDSLDGGIGEGGWRGGTHEVGGPTGDDGDGRIQRETQRHDEEEQHDEQQHNDDEGQQQRDDKEEEERQQQRKHEEQEERHGEEKEHKEQEQHDEKEEQQHDDE